jgi:hypothetical protein
MFYVIRTLRQTGTKILIADSRAQDADGEALPRVYGFATANDAWERAETVPGQVTVKEFANDTEARMYLDPACVSFRTTYDSRMAA